jgi:hypothetical protein
MTAAVAIALVCAGTASANCLDGVYNETLPITASSPADGASIAPAGSLPVSFALVSPAPLPGLTVRVTSQNPLGQNGTLSDLGHTVDSFALGDSTTDPGNYRGVSNKGPSWWTNYPGTYYWQMFGQETHFDPATHSIVCHAYASPVYTLTIAAPPPPAVTSPPAPPVTTPPSSAPPKPQLPWMTVSTARTYTYNTISGVLPRPFHHRYEYKASCTRRSAVRISCNFGFRSTPNDYFGTVTSSYLFGSDNSLEWVATYTIHWVNDRCYFHSTHPSRCRITTRHGSW